MIDIDETSPSGSISDEALALATLERDQLVESKKKPIPRRRFSGSELTVIWALRLYVVFMMVAIAFQIVHSHGN